MPCVCMCSYVVCSSCGCCMFQCRYVLHAIMMCYGCVMRFVYRCMLVSDPTSPYRAKLNEMAADKGLAPLKPSRSSLHRWHKQATVARVRKVRAITGKKDKWWGCKQNRDLVGWGILDLVTGRDRGLAPMSPEELPVAVRCCHSRTLPGSAAPVPT